MRNLKCEVCGKRIGRLDLYMHHEDGVVCSDCMIERNYFLMDSAPPETCIRRKQLRKSAQNSASPGLLQLSLPFMGE